MYRFFVEEHQIDPDRIHITGSDVNHIRNVLRMKPGRRSLSAPREIWNTDAGSRRWRKRK